MIGNGSEIVVKTQELVNCYTNNYTIYLPDYFCMYTEEHELFITKQTKISKLLYA